MRKSAVKSLRLRSRDRNSVLGRARDGYPIRVKSHEGFVQCHSTLLAEISAAALPKESRPLHLKLEIGGGFLGKNVSMNYGAAAPSGHSEVSGVLLGRREGSRLHIVAFRPMAVAPQETDGVVFSDDWERAFGGLVARVRWDPKLAGLQVAGWFRAHPKASLNLSRRDLQVFNRFFREPWQIGVVLQPQERSSRGRFFLREVDASADPFSGQDVMVRWSATRETHLPAVRPPASVPTEFPAPRDGRGKGPFWPAVVVAAAVAGTAWWMLKPPQTAAPTVQQTPQTAANSDSEGSQQAEALWKKWQSEAQQKNGAAPLAPDPLGEEIATPPAPDLAKPQPPAAPPAPHPQARKPWVPPATAAAPVSHTVIETPPPVLSATVPPDGSARTVVLPPTSTPSPPPRPVVQPARAPAPPPPTPSSGRVIWTGHVRKNDFVIFENGKASIGSLSGALPGVPVRVTVSPGDLTKDGMTVYTSRLRGSNGPAEAPGPQNGWNKTVYSWDPGRTADFEVTEAPNPKNGWKRLVLRAKNPHDSIVMVEWSREP